MCLKSESSKNYSMGYSTKYLILLYQGFDPVTFKLVDPDLIDTNPLKNALRFKMAKQEIFRKFRKYTENYINTDE